MSPVQPNSPDVKHFYEMETGRISHLNPPNYDATTGERIRKPFWMREVSMNILIFDFFVIIQFLEVLYIVLTWKW